ncbi:uncharacterized protein [Callorhinus ursinus]|uniref:uncharacterized protein n=1 Tax=Callorhinus ursinus TaxID=34884 RepID=UPI003CD03761
MVSAPCARSRARSSSLARPLSPGLAAPPRSPSRAGRCALGAAQRGWGAEAAPGHIEAAPRAPRSPQTRRRLRVAAAGPGGPGRAVWAAAAAAAAWTGDRAGPGGGGRVQAESWGLRSPREVGAGGRGGLAPPPPAPPPPSSSSPSLSLRHQQVGLGAAAAAAQSSAGGRTEAAGSRDASPRSLPRDAREAERARRGRARSHPPRPGRPACEARPARQVPNWHRAAGAEPTPLRRGRHFLPPQTQTGGSSGLVNDLDEVGGSVLPSSPSSSSPLSPALAVAPSPELRLRSQGFANFALN